MSEVKKFKITGEIKKGLSKIPFSVEFSALKKEHALNASTPKWEAGIGHASLKSR